MRVWPWTIKEDRMQTQTELAQNIRHDETPDETPVEAEFVQTSSIRRHPAGASDETSGPRISMELERWLDLDRTMWELYNLVEIAIQQRDDARADAGELDSERQVYAARLREWKTYARSLEKRLHAAQFENLELSFTVKRTAEVAQEAVALPAFARRRRRELRERLESIGGEQ